MKTEGSFSVSVLIESSALSVSEGILNYAPLPCCMPFAETSCDDIAPFMFSARRLTGEKPDAGLPMVFGPASNQDGGSLLCCDKLFHQSSNHRLPCYLGMAAKYKP
jgi:hypothetical protein